MSEIQTPDANEKGPHDPQAEPASSALTAPAPARPRRLSVFARRLVAGWALRCLIFAAACVVLRMTVLEYWVHEEHVAVEAAVQESNSWRDGQGYPAIMRLIGSARPHSWLWIHTHVDAYGPYEWFANGHDVVCYVDGRDVEAVLDSVAYGFMRTVNKNPTAPPEGYLSSASVLFSGLWAQQRLHRYALWGGCLELLAAVFICVAIALAWRKSRPPAVAGLMNHEVLAPTGAVDEEPEGKP